MGNGNDLSADFMNGSILGANCDPITLAYILESRRERLFNEAAKSNGIGIEINNTDPAGHPILDKRLKFMQAIKIIDDIGAQLDVPVFVCDNGNCSHGFYRALDGDDLITQEFAQKMFGAFDT